MKTINSLRSKLLAFTLALMASVSSFAKDGYPDFQVDELYYNFLEGDSVQVTFLMPPTVPTEVAADTSNKKNVSGAGYVHLTEIVIPSTVIYEDKTYHVTRIGHGAFMYCPNLMHIDLPTSIKSIGIAAFRNCRTLASITLNEGLESIEHHAFYDCVRLKEVTLPSTLKTMGQSIFAFSADLEKVTCKAIVPPTVEKDVLTDTDNYNAAIIANATLYVPAQSLTTYQNTYPWNTFGQILPIEDSFKDLFPTLWGLERTDVEGTTMGYDDPYHMSFSKYTPTLVDGIWYLFDGRNYFREANNQILWYAPYLNTVDAVLYDWTLQVGDTLPIYSNPFHKDNNRGSLFRVTDVSTITLLDGKEYKKWTFSGGFEVVEGIGAINKGFGHYYCLLHTTHPAVYTGWKPICISKNGQLLYQMDEIKMISNELKCMCELTPSYKDQWCNTWNTIDFDGMRFEETAETWQYKLANDTIINNQKYTIVNRYWTADRNNTKQYVAAVRFTDDRKVYIYYDNAEYLLYDFNVQEGDELEVFAGINNYTSEIKTYKCTVTGVEQYACVGCPAAITLEVHNHPNDFREFYRQTQWIEGVGDINGFLNGINHYVEVDGGYTYCLLCAYHDEEQVYTTDNEKLASYNCEYNAGYEYSSPTLAGLQRTMCREYIGYEGRNETWMTETEKEVLINDKFYRKWDKWLLREENDRIYVYSNKQDILLYDFTLEVGDSLRTLILHPDLGIIDVPIGTIYPIDTLIVTNISTVTLLDGKEYRKWSFNNGEFEYVKGIGCLDGNFLALAKDVVNGDYINSHLVCVSKNGKLLYQMDDEEMERLGAECLCEVETSYKSQWCNTWNVFTHSGGARLDSEETWQYKLDRDTIINGKLYSTVIYYLTSDPSREYYMGAVRFGDDRKVYRAIGNSESVVYDFTAQVGDTLGPGVVYDVEVDSLTNLKTIYFHPYDRYEDKYIEYATVKWIEGVGSTDGFLLAKDYGTVGGASFYLLCAYRDDELKYAANKDLGCRYNAGEVTHDHFPTLAGLSRTIYEERNTNDTTRRDDFTKVVLDLSFPTLYHSQMYLRERDNKIFVESRTYKNLTELYEYVLYDFTLEVGDSLPMLYIDYYDRGTWGPVYPHSVLNVVNYRKEADGTVYPGDTLIVTEVSTITLLDGKEYKKWTFNNGMEYAEGIGSLSGDFYELIANKRTTEDLTASHLVCASKNGQLLYKMDDTEMERLGAECLCEYTAELTPEDLFPTLWGLQRTDVELHTTGDDEAYRSAFNEYVPTLVNGKWYLYDGRNYLREENNQVLLYAPDVEIYEDIVLYDWTLEVGDTLPYHNKSVYRKSDYIVTDVSTITLLDGKEYKKWTLACGYEYIESIGAINGHGYGLFLCLPHYGHWATYIHTSLVCASRNNQLLYKMDDAEMERLGVECLCDYNSGPKKDNAKNGKIGGRPTPTQWNMLEMVIKDDQQIMRAETFSYTLENDSIVANGKTFYYLARQSTKDTAITKSFVGALHFGEDEDNRVYFLRDGVEYVLYDFTAEPGDTLQLFAGINNYPQHTTYTHVVTGKDTIDNGACRMMLEVVFPEENASVENAQKVWLAGLGSIDGIVHNAATRTGTSHVAPTSDANSSETQTSVMLCAWREDNCLYTTNLPDYDALGCVYNQDPTAVESTTAPSSYQKILYEGKLLIIHNGKIYNVMGVEIR